MLEARPPQNKKELQSLINKINFKQRFIANLVGKLKAFSSLLKLKDANEFNWELEYQEAFEKIKQVLTKPQVLCHLSQESL